MLGWVLAKLAGSKAGRLYLATRNLLSGWKTHIIGLSMAARGLAQLIDAMEGTNLSDVLELVHDPAVDLISEGFGLMTIRAGVSKAVDAIAAAKKPILDAPV